MMHYQVPSVVACAGVFFLAGAAALQAPKEGHGFVDKVFKAADGSEHKYTLFVPYSYSAEKPYPLILFLHGAGEREGGAKTPVQVGIGPAIKKYGEKDFPFFVVFPRCGRPPRNWNADGPDAQMALKILEHVEKDYRIDPDRIYLTGLSMGGHGTWSLAARYPSRWAAIVPICGSGNPKDAPKIKDLPCWCFHGDADKAVPVQRSRDMIEAIQQAGGKPRYTELPGVGHNSWDHAYQNRELYTWLLQQKRK